MLMIGSHCEVFFLMTNMHIIGYIGGNNGDSYNQQL